MRPSSVEHSLGCRLGRPAALKLRRLTAEALCASGDGFSLVGGLNSITEERNGDALHPTVRVRELAEGLVFRKAASERCGPPRGGCVCRKGGSVRSRRNGAVALDPQHSFGCWGSYYRFRLGSSHSPERRRRGPCALGRGCCSSRKAALEGSRPATAPHGKGEARTRRRPVPARPCRPLRPSPSGGNHSVTPAATSFAWIDRTASTSPRSASAHDFLESSRAAARRTLTLIATTAAVAVGTEVGRRLAAVRRRLVALSRVGFGGIAHAHGLPTRSNAHSDLGGLSAASSGSSGAP